jgi:hypothetical protein
VLVVAAAGQPGRGQSLRQRRAVQVGVHLQAHEPGVDRAAGRYPADAQAAPERLGQRVDVDHVGGRQRAQPHRLGALERHRRVDAVLEDEEAAFARERGQPRAARVGQRQARRVLARGLEHHEADLVPGEQALQGRHVEALVVDGDGQDARAGGLQRGQRAGERRRLDDGDVARREHGAGDEIEPLPCAGGDDDLLGVARPAGGGAQLGQARAQLRQPLDGQVLEAGVPVGGDRRRQFGELRRGQQRVGREPGGQLDRVGPDAQRLGEHLLGVAPGTRGQGADLPVLVVGAALDARVRPDERPASDVGGYVALLGQPAVHPRGGEVVDRRHRGQLARGRQLRSGLEDAALDVGGDALGERGRQRAIVSPKVGQIYFV